LQREAGEKRVADERRAIEAKIEKVRTALAERYEAGFKPLLKEAEVRCCSYARLLPHFIDRFALLPVSRRRATLRSCSASWTCRRSWRQRRCVL
jgi:hypothetical protein